MLGVLNSYLQDAATPELRHALEEAHQTFERINLQNYEEGFEQILMLDDNTDFGGTLESIVELTKNLQRQLLQQHEVVLDHDASLETMTIFINGLLDIQDYENQEEIIRTATMAGNPQEVFAELMALVTPRSTEELIIDIEYVNPAIINRIQELATEAMANPVSDETQAQIRQYVDGFKRFLNYIHNQPLRITMLLANGVDIGYSFATYLDLLGQSLDEMTVEKAAYELMGIGLISSDGCNNPQGKANEYLEHYISDVDKLTKIDIKMREITLGLQR